MMQIVVLLSCVSKKRRGTWKAKELYDSPLFKYSWKYAQQLQPDAIYILSAKYGLVDPEEYITDYNVTLKGMTSKERKEWAANIIKHLKQKHDLSTTQFIILAGKPYYEHLLPHFQNYQLPLDGLPIGKRLAFLKRNIGI